MTELSPRKKRQLSEEAALWYMTLQEDELSHAEKQRFLDWLRTSPQHVAEYLAVVDLHADLGAAARQQVIDSQALCEQALRTDAVVVPLRPMLPAQYTGANAGPRARGIRSRPLRWAATAAMVLAMVGVAAWAGRPMPSTGGQRYAAAADRGREVVLGDGTHIHLDQASAITVQYDAHQRRIVLERGNAVFDVMHDPARPLEVSIGAIALHDIGTVFSVQSSPQQQRVTVLSGHVQVRKEMRAQWFARWRNGQALLVDLHGGEQARLARNGDVQAVNRHADITQATAWLPSQVSLHDQPLSEVARRFNAYTRMPIHIDDPALAQRHVSGVFHLRDSEAFMAYLSSLPGVQVQRRDEQLRVIASP